MPKVTAPPFTRKPVRNRYVGVELGEYSNANLGDAGDITQFGVHHEILHPGSRSSVRHWHETEDEFLYVLSGELTLIEDTETVLRAGDAAAWPAGRPVGHCLENRGTEDARYLIVGTRAARDAWHYPDHDIVVVADEDERRVLRADGTPLPEGEAP
jgi:uncharacterized cupin superfamily protein